MTDTRFLAATRSSYDTMAVDYADMLRTDMDERPLDRALLHAFAERTLGTGNDRVADVGCGPGRVTILLHHLGLTTVGIDLSPGMVELARRTYPMLRFDVGSMLALDLPDESLGGLLAYYSIIHLPWERRADAFAEFHRVLVPGGQLMLAFQVGDERRHYDEAFGKAVDLDFYRQNPDDVAHLLHGTGFAVWCTTVKQRENTEKTPQGFVLAHKPAGDA